MKILMVGGGGREHALVWKLAQSPMVKKIYAAPGNPGMGVETVSIKIDEVEALSRWAAENKIDLVVIGPEAPLALGLADRLAELGIPAFGPKAEAARLESSKKYSKDFMQRHGIPTAAYQAFTDAETAVAYLMGKDDGPVVIKADGLAAGKGVTVAANRAEAIAAVRETLESGRFGEAGTEIVIEDFIDGEEVSLLTFTDGLIIRPMPPIQDHKRIGEGDSGPNTGGMGAYGPVKIYTSEMARQVEEKILKPVLKGLQADKLEYRGCLYVGLMLPYESSAYKGPQVIEFNARFGDPETEALMPLLNSDLAEIMRRCALGQLGGCPIEWLDETAVCVVMASKGYPGDYQTGIPINNAVQQNGNALVFHAGTELNEQGQLVTAGGRVLTVAANARTLPEALKKVYDRINEIEIEGCYFRRDIGHRELKRI